MSNLIDLLNSGSGVVGVGATSWLFKAANYTAVAGDVLAVDTTEGVVTITLPIAAVAGDLIEVVIHSGTVNEVVIANNGHNINSGAGSLSVVAPNGHVWLQYVDVVIGWESFGTYKGTAGLSGDTSFSGSVDIQDYGLQTSPCFSINNKQGSTYISSAEMLSSTMGGGQNNLFVLGKANSTRDAGILGFYYAGVGSTSNYFWLGFYGTGLQSLVKVYPSGDLEVSGKITTTAGFDSTNVPVVEDAFTNLGGATLVIYGSSHASGYKRHVIEYSDATARSLSLDTFSVIGDTVTVYYNRAGGTLSIDSAGFFFLPDGTSTAPVVTVTGDNSIVRLVSQGSNDFNVYITAGGS